MHINWHFYLLDFLFQNYTTNQFWHKIVWKEISLVFNISESFWQFEKGFMENKPSILHCTLISIVTIIIHLHFKASFQAT